MSNGSTITYVDINTVHPINISLFKKINHILDLKLSGIDYICEDLSIPYYVNGCVIEVNPKPGLEIHYDVYPENEKNDLLNTIIDNVFYPVTV
jgi:D-alanine-D-alanine ligase-like ATP-grasp enzyme